jgi:protein-tyrosine-phosphatase
MRIENVGKPLAVTLMAELGIDISKNESTSANILSKKNFDVVVTVYDNAAADCQVWLRRGKMVHISFPEPADAVGTDEEKMALFRSVRDDVRGRPQCHSQFAYLLDSRGDVNPDRLNARITKWAN